MTFRFCSQDERSIPKWRDRSAGAFGRGGVYAAFDDLQNLRLTLVNEIRKHGWVTTSDVALFDDGGSCDANSRGPRHDYGYDARVANHRAVKAAKVKAQQREWERNRRDRQVRKEALADQAWIAADREARLAKREAQFEAEREALRVRVEKDDEAWLAKERAQGDQARNAAYFAELARVKALGEQIEAERAEAETAQWVEDRNQELRERQMAREVLGRADADRKTTDALRWLVHEVICQANLKK